MHITPRINQPFPLQLYSSYSLEKDESWAVIDRIQKKEPVSKPKYAYNDASDRSPSIKRINYCEWNIDNPNNNGNKKEIQKIEFLIQYYSIINR